MFPDRKDEMKKTILVLTVCVFLCYSTAQAYLGAAITFGTVARVAGIYIAQKWRTGVLQSALKSIAVNALAIAGVGYLTYDRGTGVPPEERYMNVKLDNIYKEIRDYKAANNDKYPLPQSSDWATGSGNYTLGSNCASNPDSVQYQYPTPEGTKGCWWIYPSCSASGGYWSGEYSTEDRVSWNCNGTSICYQGFYMSCTSDQRNKYQANSFANDVANNPQNFADKLAADVSGSPSTTLDATPKTPNVTIPVDGKDVTEYNNYGDVNNYFNSEKDYIASGGEGEGGGLTQEETKDAVKQGVEEAIGTAETGSSDTQQGKSIEGDQVDTSLDEVEQDSLTDSFGEFMDNSPWASVINGSGLEASSGSCNLTTTVFGSEVEISFCELSDLLDVFGYFILLVGGLYSFLVAWGMA
jgi:hypothetical protein